MIKKNGLPEPINKNELFNLTDPDMGMFDTFSENLKKKIQSSPEWEKLSNKSKTVDDIAPKAPATSFDEDDGDIPF
jgi:hypothetical protein